MELAGYSLSRHATSRMYARRLSLEGVRSVLQFGREVHVRGATTYALGRREVAKWLHRGLDLIRYEGVHVVCVKGQILTVYRNRALTRLRRGRRGRNYHLTKEQMRANSDFGSAETQT
jgi:hypothetical protein